MSPTTLILRTAGTNCDLETAHAFELAGARTQFLHINRLLEDPSQLDAFQMLAFPGGFSYGDDINSGRIYANQLAHHLREPLKRFVEAGKPVIGICNGFQVLVKTDLLPGPIAGESGQNCTLAHNTSGRFIDRWVHLKPVGQRCIWTRGLEAMDLPIAHGEGRFVPGSEAIRQALKDEDRIALVYAPATADQPADQAAYNPNGSVDDIAGVCDASGLVFGLMPHPERHLTRYQHPAWTSRKTPTNEGAGLAVFRNAVRHAREAVGAGV